MDELLGKIIKHDIVNAYGVTIIPARTKLHTDHLLLIDKHGIDPGSMIFISESGEKCSKTIHKASGVLKEMFEMTGRSHKIPVMDIKKNVIPMIFQAAEHSNVFELLEAVKAQDDYTYQHNVGVGVLAVTIGKWLKLSESQLTALSLAASLHDIGKVKIPMELLNKPGKLTDAEFQLVKQHTIYGYEILKETVGIGHRIALTALQHHEREDGRGYPLGLKGRKIDYFSKITAVADVFHAMSSKRPYHDALPFYDVVSQMKKGAFGELDPHIVSVFLANITGKIVGKKVRLTDGRIGEVVYVNPQGGEASLIKTETDFIDLEKDTRLHIQEVII